MPCYRLYVNDVALVLRKLDSDAKPVLFYSLYDYIEDTLNFTNQLPAPKMAAFLSFPIKPGDTVAKTVVFVPFDYQAAVSYELGRYQVVPYTEETGKGWRASAAVELEITQDDLQALSLIKATPTPSGGHFVNWMIHSKPSAQQETSLQGLKAKIEQ
jgi:hypothetical protein